MRRRAKARRDILRARPAFVGQLLERLELVRGVHVLGYGIKCPVSWMTLILWPFGPAPGILGVSLALKRSRLASITMAIPTEAIVAL
jgi:hypothetical protein